MHVVFDDIQQRHVPRMWRAGSLAECPERPLRAQRLLEAALRFGCTRTSARNAGMEAIASVHSAEYLKFLQTAHGDWSRMPGAGDEVVPYVFPHRYGIHECAGVLGRAGKFMAGTNCPIGAHTWTAAYASAQTALEAAQLVVDGDRRSYALCRPPGHHAYGDMAGGFCYLNNCAVAANRLRQRFRRVAIVDIDVHHGNGTQQIFYARPDVYTVSVHADPSNCFPFYTGYAAERGTGEGESFNLNLALPHGSEGKDVLGALRIAANELRSFDPQALVVALGFDTYGGDPVGVFRVETREYRDIGEALADFDIPTVLVQEGGYDCTSLGDNLTAFLKGFLKREAP